MFTLTSPAFEYNTMIPSQYTCEGEDINPPFVIAGIPAKTKSFVLVIDDPDAPVGVWDHWVVWNIPPVRALDENSVPNGAVEGKNSWGNNHYQGPCPPSGTHRYFVKLYALDITLSLPATSTKKEVEKAIKDHIIEQTELIGLYQKK